MVSSHLQLPPRINTNISRHDATKNAANVTMPVVEVKNEPILDADDGARSFIADDGRDDGCVIGMLELATGNGIGCLDGLHFPCGVGR